MSVTIPASAWLDAWQPDVLGTAAIILGVAYLAAARGGPVPRARRAAFIVVGCLPAAALACGPIAAYAPHLFWVRALEITLLLYVVPLGLASGMPLTVLGSRLSTPRRAAALRLLRSRPVRLLAHPAVSSALLLLTPWVLLFTGWNVSAMRSPALDLFTRVALVSIGFLYFYVRIQADPVPRRFPQGLSLLITLIESLADGVLGVVVWQGPTLYTEYYASLGLHDIDQLRLSQIVGAGMLWILADVVGLPFLVILMFALRREDLGRQQRVDARLEPEPENADTADAIRTGLWWESDPALADRFRR